MITVALTLPLFICWSIGLFLIGICIGGLIIYRLEEKEFKSMRAQCKSLAIEEERLRQEREEYYKTCEMVDTIDDLPEYLRDKYYASEKETFTDSDEDISEIYI